MIQFFMAKHSLNKRSPIAARQLQPKKSHLPVVLWSILVLVVVVAVFYLQNKYLYVTSVTVTYSPVNAKYRLTDPDIIKSQFKNYLARPWLYFFKRNTPLTLSTQQVVSQFKKDGRLDSVKLIWHLPHQIALNLVEKVPVAILSIVGDKDYWLDNDGQIISPVLKPLVDLTTNQTVVLSAIYDQTLASFGSKAYVDALKMALNVFSELDGKKYRVAIRALKITQNGGYFLAEGQTDQDFTVKWLLDQAEINQEIARLKILLDNKLQDTFPQYYVDLRFGEKVYYK